MQHIIQPDIARSFERMTPSSKYLKILTSRHTLPACAQMLIDGWLISLPACRQRRACERHCLQRPGTKSTGRPGWAVCLDARLDTRLDARHPWDGISCVQKACDRKKMRPCHWENLPTKKMVRAYTAPDSLLRLAMIESCCMFGQVLNHHTE
jgi:hypothetical protein